MSSHLVSVRTIMWANPFNISLLATKLAIILKTIVRKVMIPIANEFAVAGFTPWVTKKLQVNSIIVAPYDSG